MIQGREGVGLPAAELGYQRQDRRGVLRLTREAPQGHAGVLRQRAREAGAREELRRIAVIRRSSPGDHLLQGDGEFVRAERTGPPAPPVRSVLRLYTKAPFQTSPPVLYLFFPTSAARPATSRQAAAFPRSPAG